MDVCTERKQRKRDDLMTTNPIYRCEELEDAVSLYDKIEDNDSTADKVGKADHVYLKILSDETEDHDQGTKPPLPTPRPGSGPHDQGRGYEGLEEKMPDHKCLQLLSDETLQRCDERTEAEDQVQDTNSHQNPRLRVEAKRKTLNRRTKTKTLSSESHRT